MKRSELRKIIKQAVKEQIRPNIGRPNVSPVSRFAYPMTLDGILGDMERDINISGGTPDPRKPSWKRFKGAMQHLWTGEPNDNCGCLGGGGGPGGNPPE